LIKEEIGLRFAFSRGFLREFRTELENVKGAKNLFDWFGYWPRFHDAEVISLCLNRRGASSLVLHAWEMAREIDENGHYVLAKHIVTEFLMKDIGGLSLSGFNHQNVISGLAIERVENGYRLTLEDCYGVTGTIDTTEISIRLTPGEPEED
jgi:Immunity protein 50